MPTGTEPIATTTPSTYRGTTKTTNDASARATSKNLTESY
jgi:hypothetical protein